MLNRLAALFQKAWDVTEKEFIAKLEQGGIKYTVNRIQGWTYIGRPASRRAANLASENALRETERLDVSIHEAQG